MHEAFSEKNENLFLAARRELRLTRECAAEQLQWINEDRLEKISVTTEALQLWVEKMKAQGAFSSL